MPAKRITKKLVDGNEPGAKVQFVWDSEISGFCLKITPGGCKSYVFQYRLGGRDVRTVRTTIGRHGSLTPEMARKEGSQADGSDGAGH